VAWRVLGLKRIVEQALDIARNALMRFGRWSQSQEGHR
jgi:hypothetical protein